MASSSSQSSQQSQQQPTTYPYWFDVAASRLTDVICTHATRTFNVEVDADTRDKVLKALSRPRDDKLGDVALPCFVFAKATKQKPPAIASQLAASMSEEVKEQGVFLGDVKADGPYLNCFVRNSALSGVIDAVIDGDMLKPMSPDGKEKVMIEYSQPNTHKAFHVGHMRNAALGDCLVRLFEHQGHQVVAANYFGDEGAHVAKCLWYLKRFWLSNPENKLESIPVEERGEFLGGCYSQSVGMLDLTSMTSMPYMGLVAAEVVSIANHPAADAPKNWHVVQVRVVGGSDETCTVVCGGTGYVVGDKVAYAPVGIKFANKAIVPKDMKGVESCGIMVAYREVGLDAPMSDEEKATIIAAFEEEEKAAAAAAAAAADDSKQPQDKKKKKGGGGGGKKSKKGGAAAAAVATAASKKIYVLPAAIEVGQKMVDYGRLPNSSVPDDVLVSDEYARRTREVAETLRKLEDRSDPDMSALWDKTKEWSLADFRAIYKWLNVRFDHEFYESEVSEESKAMVEAYEHSEENKQRQVLTRSNGALGADLSKYKLGFAMVLKSNGAGLYATKDLALAKRKFQQFQIEKSIYVIDAAQSLHCQQVFKVLELMGFEQAKQCFHLAYGQVVLPSGKMSSRTGTVILFSALKQQLYDQIFKDFLEKYATAEDPAERWSTEEIEDARRAIALATIKYGMLCVNPSSDITFEMEKWTAKSGNTGPYIMYAYARISKILRDIPPVDGAVVDYSVLQNAKEHSILVELNEVQQVFRVAAYDYNPSRLTQYLFNLSQLISAWYELPGTSVKNAEPNVQATRLRFLTAIRAVLEKGLHLLGIEVLQKM